MLWHIPEQNLEGKIGVEGGWRSFEGGAATLWSGRQLAARWVGEGGEAAW